MRPPSRSTHRSASRPSTATASGPRASPVRRARTSSVAGSQPRARSTLAPVAGGLGPGVEQGALVGAGPGRARGRPARRRARRPRAAPWDSSQLVPAEAAERTEPGTASTLRSRRRASSTVYIEPPDARGLDHHHHVGQRRHQPVAGREPPPGRLGAERVLAEHHPRAATSCHRAPAPRRVDARRARCRPPPPAGRRRRRRRAAPAWAAESMPTARPDTTGTPARAQASAQLVGHLGPGSGAAPGADDGDGGPGERLAVPDGEEHHRGLDVVGQARPGGAASPRTDTETARVGGASARPRRPGRGPGPPDGHVGPGGGRGPGPPSARRGGRRPPTRASRQASGPGPRVPQGPQAGRPHAPAGRRRATHHGSRRQGGRPPDAASAGRAPGVMPPRSCRRLRVAGPQGHGQGHRLRAEGRAAGRTRRGRRWCGPPAGPGPGPAP